MSMRKIPFAGFNRTFMELKVSIFYFLQTMYFRFNRTFMELKGGCKTISVPQSFSFNRTFMELKEKSTHLMLIIILFQSHLYGIERQER